MEANKIAVLITCHNRRATTISCLTQLTELLPDVDVYCVDDASSDGTATSIKEHFPLVHLIEGDGNLFWSRGMNLAWRVARNNKDYDFYLWLNDDVRLYQNAFDELFQCSSLAKDDAIISGIVQGESSGQAIYGGFDKRHKIINPSGKMEPISNLNGNVVLVPKSVFNAVGFLDPTYHHDIGDVDYGLTAQEKGISVLSTRCFIAKSKEALMTNNRIRKQGVNIRERFRKLNSPLGAPPRIHFYFIRKHHNWFRAALYVVYLCIINVLPDNVYNCICKLNGR